MGLIVSWDIAVAIALYILGVATAITYYFASSKEEGGSRSSSKSPRGGDENLP